jgi:hypothetical protein
MELHGDLPLNSPIFPHGDWEYKYATREARVAESGHEGIGYSAKVI